MEKTIAASLYTAYEKALKALSEAEPDLWDLPKSDERDALTKAHTSVVVQILSKLRAPLVLEFPELDTERPNGPPDNLIEPEYQDAVDQLTVEQIADIDRALLSDCAPSWRKVARVVGSAMSSAGLAYPDIPDSFYARRIGIMVQQGLLESQGNLDYMRYSEVRLP